MSIIGHLTKFTTGKSARRFEQAARDPLATQTHKLMSIVRANQDTEYGQRYGFDAIRTIADYQERVPVIGYEDIRPDIERALAGERTILTAEDPVMFAQTSGTTGDAKFIPVTPTCQGRDHKDVSRTWACDINDVIEVVDTYHQTPQIVFLLKGRGMTNLTGEKVSVNQIINAYEKASQTTSAIPDHFKAEADLQNSRYLFRVEFANPVDGETRRAFLQAIDNELNQINMEIKAKRDSQRLGEPVLHIMKQGWYEPARKQQVVSGKRAFQAKTEVLSPMKQETVAVRPDLDEVVEMS